MKKNVLIQKIFLIILSFSIVLPSLPLKAKGSINTNTAKSLTASTSQPLPTPQPLLNPTPTFLPDLANSKDSGSYDKSIQTDGLPPRNTSAAESVYDEAMSNTIVKLKNLTLEKQSRMKVIPFSSWNTKTPPHDLTKKDIESLALKGASTEDIYWLNMLFQDHPELNVLDLLNLKQNGKKTWEEIFEGLDKKTEEEGISVSDTVYTNTLRKNILGNEQTVTASVYRGGLKVSPLNEDITASTATTFDANVYSVFSGLITQQQINQTSKQQYSDHSGSSELIDPTSGSLTWKETEISLPGRDDLDLNIGIMYNSNQSFTYMRNYESYRSIKKYNYLVSRYDLGIGWSFQFPSVQMADGYMYYHDGQGAVYRIDLDSYSGLESYTHLVGYKGKEIRFLKDDNRSFGNGQSVSAYYLEYLDKKREYFDSEGLLLGIVDRFGNTIRFEHVSRRIYTGENHSVISAITDSLGRTVNFNYESNLNMTDTFYGEKIVVTVNDKNGTESQRVTFTKARISLIFDGNPDGYAPTLWKTTDQIGQNNLFTYDSDISPKFNYYKKIIDEEAGYNSFSRLITVSYPSSTINYKYELVRRNLGWAGIGEEYRVTSRFDSTINKSNQIKYTYSEDYTGYPSYNNPEDLPETYKFSSTYALLSSTLTNGLATTLTYNGKQQLVSTSTQAANGERKVATNTVFDSTFTYSPTRTTISDYEAGDSEASANHLYSEVSYTDWGEVKTQTQPLPLDQWNNGYTKLRYTTTLTYEPVYHFLESKTWYQNEADNTPSTERITYTPEGRIATFTNANNEQTMYSYGYVNSSGQIQQMTAEKRANNQLVSKTVTNYGAEFQYAYPTEQQQWMNIGQANQQIVKTMMSYDLTTGSLLSQSNGNGGLTRYEYDAIGRPRKVTYPNYTNASGTKYSETEDLSYAYTYSSSFDSTNAGSRTLNVQSIKTLTKNSDGGTMKTYVSSYYNGLGLLLLEEQWDEYQAKWVQTQYHYDDQGRPVYMKDAVGNTNTVSYDSWGQQKLSTDTYGNQYVMEHHLKARNDVSYMLAAGTNEKFNYISQNYDHRGNIISKMTYKDWPSQTYPIREFYSYDISGNITNYYDPNLKYGVTTTYRYDPLNRLISVIDALNQTTSYTYDGNGKITNVSVRARGGAPQTINNKTYNELGLLKEKKDASSRSETFQYNALGLPVSKIDRKGTVYSTQYDEQNQLISTTLNGIISGSTVVQDFKSIFGDERANQKTSKSYLNGVVTASRNDTIDSMGQTRSYYAVAGNHGAYILNNKDMIGRTTQINDNFLNFYTNYQYDKKRLSKVQTNGSQAVSTEASANVQYSYYANGQVQSITYPPLIDGSILKTEYTYNKALNWVESVTNKRGNSILSQYQYGYDNNGNITSVTETRNNGAPQTTTYTYDLLNRLSTVVYPGGGRDSYTYDTQGNRLTLGSNVGAGFKSQYAKYTYDLLNTLTSFSKGGSTTNFTYYADGLRFNKATSSSQTQYNYNFNGAVITEEKNTGQKANYVRGDRVLVKKDKTAGRDYYYLYNGHGDVVQIVDTSGNIVNSYAYDEWGNITSQTEGISNSFKYSGEIYDEETGLYYLRARYYDPSIGRFLNEDTVEGQIDNPLSQNIYTYVHNNPMIYRDPSGNYCESNNGRYSHGGGCSNPNSIYIPDKIKDSNPNKSISDLLKLYTNQKKEAVEKAKNIEVLRVQKNEVALPMNRAEKIAGAIAKAIAVGIVVGAEVDSTVSKQKKLTPIYRGGGHNYYQLTPRADDANLSFSLNFYGKKGMMTTMEAVNATGVLKAINDKPGHVAIIAVDPYEMEIWKSTKENANKDPYYLSEILFGITIKY